jgi:hypothetical protein
MHRIAHPDDLATGIADPAYQRGKLRLDFFDAQTRDER